MASIALPHVRCVVTSIKGRITSKMAGVSIESSLARSRLASRHRLNRTGGGALEFN